MVFQDRLAQVANLREQTKLELSKQHKAIGEQWIAILPDLLGVMGEKTWGEGRYSITNNTDYTAWTLINFKGAENSQFFVAFDFQDLDIEAIIATDQSLPEVLTRHTGFSIIGSDVLKSGPTKAELEQALIEAFQKGPNKDQLPEGVTKELKKLPYQIDEYDQRSWWLALLMWLSGPVTIIMGIIGAVGIPISVINEVSYCNSSYPPSMCNSSGEIILYVGSMLLFWVACLIFLFASIWGIRVSKFGRRFNKLITKTKLLIVTSWLPGLLFIPCVSIAIVLAFIGFLGGLSQEAKKSEMKQAVHEELKEHGL